MARHMQWSYLRDAMNDTEKQLEVLSQKRAEKRQKRQQKKGKKQAFWKNF